jgi:hypothetical protein
LSRMVAVPRDQRTLRHVSTPLRRQMRTIIDRGRWPVLVTYHDEGQGHTGHVYKCSGWEATVRNRRPVYEDESGCRSSDYKNGKHATGLVRKADTYVQRWEHWACPRGCVDMHLADHGWRQSISGLRRNSDRIAYTWTRQRDLFEREVG